MQLYEYILCVKIDRDQTLHVKVWAPTDSEAGILGQAQYGQGSLLSMTRIEPKGHDNGLY